jgi:hypothetical protein
MAFTKGLEFYKGFHGIIDTYRGFVKLDRELVEKARREARPLLGQGTDDEKDFILGQYEAYGALLSIIDGVKS